MAPTATGSLTAIYCRLWVHRGGTIGTEDSVRKALGASEGPEIGTPEPPPP